MDRALRGDFLPERGHLLRRAGRSSKNRVMKTLALFVVLIPSLSLAAIFGQDDRVAVFPGSPWAKLGRSTAVAVLSSNIAPSASNPNLLDLETTPLSEGVCKDEKFASDTSLSYACSGFLVGPDLMVTAGHCMTNFGETKDETAMYCEAYGWLFDYQRNSSGLTKTKGLDKDLYYKCKKIIYAVKEETYPYRDYALVQLDRPVKDREPLKLAARSPGVGEAVSMLGHPLGTPLKLSWNARVLIDNPERQSQITTLDAFEGNSGSAVFNSAGEVTGILVGGTPYLSLIPDEKKQCQRYNRCDERGENCTVPDTINPGSKDFQGIGSEVQRIGPILELLKTLKPAAQTSAR